MEIFTWATTSQLRNSDLKSRFIVSRRCSGQNIGTPIVTAANRKFALSISPAMRVRTHVTSRLLASKARRITDKLRTYHALGASSHRNGRVPLSSLMLQWGLSLETVCKIRAFAKGYSKRDLSELCKLRRSNGLPFHWGYVSCFLSEPDKRKRRNLQKRAAREDWSVAELQAAVKQRNSLRRGRVALAVGRPLRKLSDRRRGLKRIAADVRSLERRLEQLSTEWALHSADGASKRELVSALADVQASILRVTEQATGLCKLAANNATATKRKTP